MEEVAAMLAMMGQCRYASAEALEPLCWDETPLPLCGRLHLKSNLFCAEVAYAALVGVMQLLYGVVGAGATEIYASLNGTPARTLLLTSSTVKRYLYLGSFSISLFTSMCSSI